MSDHTQYLQLKDCELAYKSLGSGPPLLMLHGYPLSGLTWRNITSRLLNHFTCLVPDLAGAGETRWTELTDFGFKAQAQRLHDWADALNLKSYSILAHDTGATIARQLALCDPQRVRHLVLIGTEIPNHRPPWIPLFQKTANPRSVSLFRFLMRQKWFLESSAGFGGCFFDRTLIRGDFYRQLIAPALASDRRIRGLTRYLLGIDWELVDSLATRHAQITAPTLLIWGEHDTVFPIAQARAMIAQLGNCKGFVSVPKARAFLHEEHPQVVAELVKQFILEGKSFPTV